MRRALIAGAVFACVFAGGSWLTAQAPTGNVSTGTVSAGAAFTTGTIQKAAAGGLLTDSVLTESGGIVTASGSIIANTSLVAGNIVQGKLFSSATNCSSAAAPAVCATASAGSVVVAASATTVVVNTTAVTANSQIFVTYDSSLGTKLSVTCNVTEPALYGVTARTAATSFTITSTAPITNPACFSYFVLN